MAILPSARGHGDSQIDVVAPAHHLHLHASWQLHVHDVSLQVAHRPIHEFSLIVVCHDAQARNQVEGAEAREDHLVVKGDLAILHRPNSKHVALHEGTADGHGVCCCQAVGEGRRLVAALDLNISTLDDPLDALAVKVCMALVEGVDVRVTPDLACAWGQAPARAWWLLSVGAAPRLLGCRPNLPGVAIEGRCAPGQLRVGSTAPLLLRRCPHLQGVTVERRHCCDG
mmetsp:Transcript_34263/g.86995  ORF Transcript_34263/g.86995 Transcript_34263/m.86995 type:complete len:227 (+) Transcript_34263:609-1289(+)